DLSLRKNNPTPTDCFFSFYIMIIFLHIEQTTQDAMKHHFGNPHLFELTTCIKKKPLNRDQWFFLDT
ncbi:hypothetical protein, partial [Clostridium perfringens]|uniref:hypothetical protein n=1 Tax=Clostridium perfringens TaxID=1502 RepID=UPI002ACC3461